MSIGNFTANPKAKMFISSLTNDARTVHSSKVVVKLENGAKYVGSERFCQDLENILGDNIPLGKRHPSVGDNG